MDRRRLDKLISKASSLLGCSLHLVEVVGNRRRGARLSSMQQTDSKPMKETLTAPENSFRHPNNVKE